MHKLHCNVNNRTVGLAEGECNCTPYCIWCSEEVAEVGDTCNLVCYTNAVQAIKLALYLKEGDTINDMYLQPWYAALANTQEGTSEL